MAAHSLGDDIADSRNENSHQVMAVWGNGGLLVQFLSELEDDDFHLFDPVEKMLNPIGCLLVVDREFESSG
jgi:hypothetical protein